MSVPRLLAKTCPSYRRANRAHIYWTWAPNAHGRVNPSVACVLARYYDRSVESGDLYLAAASGLISYLEREAIMRLDGTVGIDADASLILALADRLGVPHSDTELPPRND